MNSVASVGDLIPQPCTSSVLSVSSYTAVPGSTATSRSRALNVQHKREMAKATVKDVDVVHQGLKRLETRMHELESRVQYVNPWVVQHMWELLCDLRERVGVHFNMQRERAWIEEMQNSRHQRGKAQPTTEPKVTTSSQRGTVDTSSAIRAGGLMSAPVTPVRLFDRSGGEVNEVDTSVSSESDNEDDNNDNKNKDHNELYEVSGSGDMSEFDARSNRIQGKDRDGISNKVDAKAKDRLKYRRQLQRYVEIIEERWEGYRIVQDESTARMELVLEESTYRNLLFSRLVSTLTTMVSHGKNYVSSSESDYLEMGSNRVHQDAMQQQIEPHYRISNKNSRSKRDCVRRKRGDIDFPSPPRTELPSGISPIQVKGSPSEFFSPQTGNVDRNSLHEGIRQEIRNIEETDEYSDTIQDGIQRRHAYRGDDSIKIVVSSLLGDDKFMQQIVDEVSRRLAALIQNSEITIYNDSSPSQSLPSALLLVVRDAVKSIAGAHDEEFSRQLHDYLTEQQRVRETREEELWQRIMGHITTWERQSTAARKEGEEMLQQQQQFVARGKEDAELCAEVRGELLKLCGEVMRTVEHMHEVSPVVTSPAAHVSNREGVSTVGHDRDDRQNRMELRLETLSAAVNGLYAEVEAVRRRPATPHPSPAVELRGRQTDEELAGLRVALDDVREAVAIVARRSRAAEERLRGVEQRLDEHPPAVPLNSTPDPPPPPPPLPPPSLPILSNGSGGGGQSSANRMSVEEAMVDTQRVLLAHKAKETTAIDPFVKAVTALCSTLQQVNHLYNVGTGTFGGSLQLIFAMPPFSLPRTLISACQAYLREHSAAELKESLNALGIILDVSEVLCDCYYWMQSHVLAVGGEYGGFLQVGGTEKSGTSLSSLPSSVPLRTTVVMTSGNIVPSSCINSGTTTDALKKTQKFHSNCKIPQNSSCDMAAQTELPTTTTKRSSSSSSSSSASSSSEETKPSDHNALKSNKRKNKYIREEKQERDEKQIVSASPTPLEALALSHSPDKAVEPVSGVVHHYHHHHNCFSCDGNVLTTSSHCITDEENKFTPKSCATHTTGLQSNGEDQWESLGGTRQKQKKRNTVQYMEPSLLDMSESSAPPPVPMVNRSHVFGDKRGMDVNNSTNSPGYPLLNMVPTPSMYNECLPLPTAVSCFTDPGQVTRTGGHKPSSLKNPQPFYTATLQQIRKSQHQQSNQTRSSRETMAEEGGNLNGRPQVRDSESYDTMRRSPHFSQGRLLSTTLRNREDVISNVMAAQLHHKPFLYHDDKPLATKKSSTRR
ncbi:uncharacterized protein TM35_000034200 [Trypanosoma theileri]|uniref:Uncharacterized protein n=1 Tax=Trypanosoma theileri TaxID=67003 RepID=A0A1X0P6V2_9TRYP|nr:uncharacterized protein TM35_000034200 [Trypanosoma theileri]ORC92667.1 hypothetical protein TM35_000034200 [Trypanosoma theileri]